MDLPIPRFPETDTFLILAGVIHRRRLQVSSRTKCLVFHLSVGAGRGKLFLTAFVLIVLACSLCHFQLAWFKTCFPL